MTELALTLPPEAAEAIARRAAELVLEQLARERAAPETKPFLTVPEAAVYLGKAPALDRKGRVPKKARQRVDDLLYEGKLTRHKDGSRTLVSRAELDELLAAEGPPVDTLGLGPRGVLARAAG